MEKEQPKKCFCARCFQPITSEEDKVDIGGQNFHRTCTTCCVCRTIPTSIKMFYGHVFCNECFKTHVLGRFRGEAPRVQCSNWWMQWAPVTRPGAGPNEDSKQESKTSQDTPKKFICSRCLQTVNENEKVDICGQHFHPQCAKCYCCQTVPTNNLKIYYGQVFCEECFNRHVLNRSRDNPSEFFKTCFEQWQNVNFAESMRQFMGCNNCNKEWSNPPFIFCRCAGQNEWGAQPDTRKSATPGNVSIREDESLEDLYFENRTEMSDFPEPYQESQDTPVVPAAEKIEKLTKYLHDVSSKVKSGKKWKNFVESDKISLTSYGWVDLQDGKVNSFDCPKCLWQCGGPIYVPSELLKS